VGPIATTVAVGCLAALRWLLWLAAALLFVLVLVQYFRGDQDARPGLVALVALGFLVAGCLSGFIARRL